MRTPQAYYPTLSDKADPTKEIRKVTNYLRTLIQGIQVQTQGSADFITKQEADTKYSAVSVRKMLQTGGAAFLNVTDLPGVLAQPQVAGVKTGTATPSLLSPLSQNGTLFIITPTNTIFFFDGSSAPGTWKAASAAPSSGYLTIQQDGAPLAQRSILNILSTGGLLATDTGAVTQLTYLSNLLAAGHGDTLAAAVVRGDLIVGNATPKWTRLPLGTTKNYIRSNGTDAVYSAIQQQDLPVQSNVAPVTVNANSTGDQNLQSVTIPSNAINDIGDTLICFSAGIYTTLTLQTPTLTFKLKLGALTLATFTSTASIAGAANIPWNLDVWISTVTTGGAATLEVHGTLKIDLGASGTVSVTAFADANTATVGTVDLTVNETLQLTVAFSSQPVGAPFNVCTQRLLAVR